MRRSGARCHRDEVNRRRADRRVVEVESSSMTNEQHRRTGNSQFSRKFTRRTARVEWHDDAAKTQHCKRRYHERNVVTRRQRDRRVDAYATGLEVDLHRSDAPSQRPKIDSVIAIDQCDLIVGVSADHLCDIHLSPRFRQVAPRPTVASMTRHPCRRLRRLATMQISVIEGAPVTTAAIFDLDRTLISVSSTPIFMRHLATAGISTDSTVPFVDPIVGAASKALKTIFDVVGESRLSCNQPSSPCARRPAGR